MPTQVPSQKGTCNLTLAGDIVSKNATSHDFMSQELGAVAAAGIIVGGPLLGRSPKSHKISVNLVLIAKFVAE